MSHTYGHEILVSGNHELFGVNTNAAVQELRIVNKWMTSKHKVGERKGTNQVFGKNKRHYKYTYCPKIYSGTIN
jgi:hypothetical protein